MFYGNFFSIKPKNFIFDVFWKEVALDDTATKKDIEQAMQGHILEKAELVGLYKKE